jgi:hypothetical protein
LTDHESNGDEGTLSVTRDGEHLLEKILDAGTSNEHALVLKLVGDVLDLVLNICVRLGQVSHAGKYCRSLLPLVLLGEETGRLLVQSHAADKENGGKSLESEWDNVDLSAAGEMHKRSVVDPEGKTGS